MDIRRLKRADLSAAKSVWEKCFHDSDAFIDAYFKRVVDIRSSLGFFEEKRLVADLFMLDFSACLSGVPYDTAFLAGCATLPEVRKRGLMRMLVKQALLLQSSQRVAVSYLHPFLHAFYRRFGYETVAYVDRHEIAINRKSIRQPVTVATDIKKLPLAKLMQAYETYTSRYDNYFIRSPKRFESWLGLLFSDGGMISYIEDGDRCAYALYYMDKGATDVFELVSFDESQLLSLLHSCPGAKAKYFFPGRIGTARTEFTMMRVIDPAAVLRRYPYGSDGGFVIRVHDDFLEVEHNLGIDVKNGKVSVRKVQAACDFETDINTFATLAAGAYDPRRQNELHRIFSPKTSCFFETY